MFTCIKLHSFSFLQNWSCVKSGLRTVWATSFMYVCETTRAKCLYLCTWIRHDSMIWWTSMQQIPMSRWMLTGGWPVIDWWVQLLPTQTHMSCRSVMRTRADLFIYFIYLTTIKNNLRKARIIIVFTNKGLRRLHEWIWTVKVLLKIIMYN